MLKEKKEELECRIQLDTFCLSLHYKALKERSKELDGVSADLSPVGNPELEQLVDDLVSEAVIKSKIIAKVMKSIDRKDFCLSATTAYLDS